MNRSILGLCGLVLLAVSSSGAWAEGGGVGYSRNRLVYPADERAISITASNHGDGPYLIQAGVSGEAYKTTPAPFMVTPPLSRLEGHGDNVIRIIRSGGNLPQDRESVFYFYATAVPGRAGPEKASTNAQQIGATLSISMKTVLKLFWRPKGLKMSPQESPSLMQFTNTGKAVVVKNPTPYYQSFALLSFDGDEQNLDSGPSMVAPFSDLTIPTRKAVHSVTWQVMTDYGGTTDKKTQTVK